MNWKDVKRIREIMDEVWDEYLEAGINGKEFTDEDYYKEIARRYNEIPDSSIETLLKCMELQRRVERKEITDVEGLKLQLEILKQDLE